MAYVTAALVIAKLANGSDVYLYEGTELPDGLLDGEEARLIEAGLVGKNKDDAPAAKKAAAAKSSK